VKSNALFLQATVGATDGSLAKGSVVLRAVKASDYEAAVKIDSEVNFAAGATDQKETNKTGMAILCNKPD